MTAMLQDVEQERLLTVSEAAKRLRCGLTSVYKLMSDGDLPYVRILKGARRIEEGALEDFIVAHRIAPRIPSRRWGRKETISR